MKGQHARMKLKPDAKTIFCCARSVPKIYQDQVKKMIKLGAQGVIEPVEHEVVIIDSPVICQRNNDGSFDYSLTTKFMSMTN